MPVTLAQAKLNTTDDVDVNIIDEFQKQSWLVANLPFDDVVNGAGAGGTLTYGYQRADHPGDRRVPCDERGVHAAGGHQAAVHHRPQAPRWLVPDRPRADRMAAAAETEFQMRNKIKGANAAFNDAVINGDTAVDANGFDGLSKALTGSTTELGATTAPTGPRSPRATTPRSPRSTSSTS
jgi:hypothetical protein